MRLAKHRNKMHAPHAVCAQHGKRRWCVCVRADGVFVCVRAYVIVRVHVPEYAWCVVRVQSIYARASVCAHARARTFVPSFIDADLLTCTWSWLTSPALNLLLRDVPNPPGLDALPSNDERAEFDPLTDHEPLLRWLNKACGDRDLSESALDR
jgi:nitrite reductase/ring-hydroxylating ferredoxin subunit